MTLQLSSSLRKSLAMKILLILVSAMALSAQPPAPVDPSSAVVSYVASVNAYVAWAQTTIKNLQDQVATNATVNAWMNTPTNGQLLRVFALFKGMAPTTSYADSDTPTQACVSWAKITVSPSAVAATPTPAASEIDTKKPPL
jgi:hypothetical protein